MIPAKWYIQPMSQAPIALQIGGQTYRVRAQATEQDLQRLAAAVDARLRLLSAHSHSTPAPQALLLVAISLAHDLEHERILRTNLQRQANDILQMLLEQVDRTLTAADCALASLPQNAAPIER